MAHKAAILWFRKGLRLHDNPALLHALKHASVVYPLFVIDPWFFQKVPETGSAARGSNRANFLLEALTDLDASLRKHDSRLFVARGKPATVIPALLQEWDATLLAFETDTEPYARMRDAEITKAASAANVAVETFSSHTLFDMEHLYCVAGGRSTTAYSAFQKICARAGRVRAPVATPTALQPPQGAEGYRT